MKFSTVLEAKFVTATKELVDALLAINLNNRKVRMGTVRRYERLINRHQWCETNQGIGVTMDGVLADGQHRLLAIKNCGYPKVPLLLVTGLPNDVYQFIDNGAKRSFHDSTQLSHGLTKHWSVAIETLANMRWRGAYWTMAQHDRVSTVDIESWIEKYESGFGVLKDACCKPTYFRAGVRAALLVYAQTYPERAAEFIRKVEFGEDIKQFMPAYHLRAALLVPGSVGGRVGVDNDFNLAVRAISSDLLNLPMRVWKYTMCIDWVSEIKERMPHVDSD